MMMKVFKDTSFGDGKAITFFNPRTYTQIYPPAYKGGGWNPPEFLIFAVFRNDFAVSGKPLNYSTR